MTLTRLAFLAFLLTASGCSKVLNEAGAKALIEEQLRNQRYIVSVQPILSLMAQSDVDYNSPTARSDQSSLLKALLEGAFVRQEIRVNSYPVILGSWEGTDTCVAWTGTGNAAERLDYVLNNRNRRCFTWTEKVQFQSADSRISGTARGIPVEGTISPPNTITFSRLAGPQGSDGPFWYIERGGQAFLVGEGPYLYSGTASGRRIDVKTFHYSFAPSLDASSGELPVGRFEVGDISNLRLTLETQATANFAWRVALDPLGKALLSAAPSGSGTADFAKKPDGTWVLATPPSIPHGALWPSSDTTAVYGLRLAGVRPPNPSLQRTRFARR